MAETEVRTGRLLNYGVLQEDHDASKLEKRID